ncbi:unnamed protein product [Adineta steineri]|nr:unnamed protein product [Adineta steineri]
MFSHFQALLILCNLIKDAVNDARQNYLTSSVISASMIDYNTFNEQMNASLSQFKSTLPNQFSNNFQLIREMVQANGLVSLYSSNWYPLLHDWTDYQTVYMEPQYYGNCSCFTSSSCTQPAAPHMKGYLVGCTPIEALLRSSIACLYEQDCINTFTVYLNLPLPAPLPLNIIDSSGIQSTYSSALTIYSQVYSRPDSLLTTLCYFQDIQMEVTTTGTYTILSNSSMDAYGYIYNNSFNISNPAQNLLTSDNDAGGNGQFMLKIVLQAGVKYILTMTTFWSNTLGVYSIIGSGPDLINFSTVNSSKIQSDYSSALTIYSPMYFRDRNSSSTSLFYYEAIQISVSMTGIYTIVSNSNMDSKGYIYRNNFNASFPDENLLFIDDNMAGHEQFMLTVILDAMINYILVVTTYSESVMGTFSIIGLGSDLVYFSPIKTSPIQSNYISTWSFRNQLYVRAQSPWPTTSYLYYYQSIQVNVATTGIYTIFSNSTIDTCGYLYNDTLNPLFPDQNLLLWDDGVTKNLQFTLSIYLQAMTQYILVVTPYWPSRTGAFSINALGPGSMNLSTNISSTIKSQYSSALSAYSPVFIRPRSWGFDDPSYFFYQSIRINVTTTGAYTIFSDSPIDTYGFLYSNTFDPSFPDQNLMLYNDNAAAPNYQFVLIATLQAMKQYILVVTTYWPGQTAAFSIIEVGPASIGFSIDISSTIKSQYSSALSIYSSVFTRYQSPSPTSYYFYQSIQINVVKTGIYAIASNSTMDTYGYLYNDTLNPLVPYQNLMLYNDNAAPNSQFMFIITLQAMKQYTLVVTTYGAITTGTFSIIALGPASMNFSTDNSSTIKSQYSSALSIYSPVFNRSQSPSPTSYFYYESIQINVATTGIYTIVSNSTMNTYGYLYNDTLNPLVPDQNLMLSDNDAAPNSQFMLIITLQAMKQYTLVVTTYAAMTTGTFSIIGVGPASMNFSTIDSSMIQSNYLSALTTYSPTFIRPNRLFGTIFYYQAIQISVSISGFYTISSVSTIDTYGYLYNNSFNSSVPSRNLLSSDDDSGGNSQFMFIIYLQAMAKDVLVATTYTAQIKGIFSIIGLGPSLISYTRLNTSANASKIDSFYSSNLTTTSPLFCDKGTCPKSTYFYQSIQLNVSTTGSYTILSSSSINTYGYIYNSTFNSSSPTFNKIASDDDSGGSSQFMFNVTLQVMWKYILVVTTFSINVTGSFSLVTSGPGPVSYIIQ